METLQDLGRAFIEQARFHLTEDFMPKIRKCVDLLDEEDIWWRSHENNNSVANLTLHLSGNVTQWIVSGLGCAPDFRERSKEFSERSPISKQKLLLKLEAAVSEADQVLSVFPVDQLRVERVIQGYQTTGLKAVFQVVEHFSYHTGQIVYITKLRKGIDLKFYDL